MFWILVPFSVFVGSPAAVCNSGGARLAAPIAGVEPGCLLPGDDAEAVAVEAGNRAPWSPPSPVIPTPSTTCAGSGVVTGWCLADAPLLPTQPRTDQNYTDAECCAVCVGTPTCVAWNTNSGQQGSPAGGCHLRGGVGTPNPGTKCHFGVVRPPPPRPPTPPPPPPPQPAPRGAKNLLVLVCDDFRPGIKPFTDRYGIQAPNLEKLASESMAFNNTYVQQAVCGPSRNSFMTGKRPDSTNVWTFKTNFRRSGLDTAGTPGSDWTTFPQIFKENGWNTVGLGKIFHPSSPPANDCPTPHPLRPQVAENCPSWSTKIVTPDPVNITAIGNRPTQITHCYADHCNVTYFQPDAQIGNCAFRIKGKTWNPTCCDLPDQNCTDLWLADAAVRTLHTVAADKTKPFALFVGFHKPHPFWDVPQRYQDMYTDVVPLPTNLDAATDLPDVAYYSCTSVNGRSDVGGVNCNDTELNPAGCSYIMPNASYAAKVGLQRTPPALMRKIRAGYAGGTTWTDLQIGKVLDALDATGERDNTLVLWWADHGWALGEQGMFCKMANFELQTRVPLLIRAPWLNKTAIGSTTAMVELVDMYPTAIELTGLGDRIKPGPLGLEGFSVAPLLANPSLHQTSPQSWKRAAFSQYPRCMNSTLAQQPPFLATQDPCISDNANEVTHMGYSMRTAEWRYAEWPAWRCFGLGGDPNRCADMSAPGAVWAGSADWTALAGQELYSHHGDVGDCFDCFENVNLAYKPDYASVVAALSKQLRAGWRGAAPAGAALYLEPANYQT